MSRRVTRTLVICPKLLRKGTYRQEIQSVDSLQGRACTMSALTYDSPASAFCTLVPSKWRRKGSFRRESCRLLPWPEAQSTVPWKDSTLTAEIPVPNQKTRGSGGDDLLNEFNMLLEGGLVFCRSRRVVISKQNVSRLDNNSSSASPRRQLPGYRLISLQRPPMAIMGKRYLNGILAYLLLSARGCSRNSP